jgi:hypothetical protein
MSHLLRKLPTADVLASALLAAELGEPCDTQRLPMEVLQELFSSVGELRVSVPYATLKLVARLANDGRVDVRAQAARALGWLASVYPEGVEELLLMLACDTSRKVRQAAGESLADLLACARDPAAVVEAWSLHTGRARDVLDVARRSLPASMGV